MLDGLIKLTLGSPFPYPKSRPCTRVEILRSRNRFSHAPERHLISMWACVCRVYRVLRAHHNNNTINVYRCIRYARCVTLFYTRIHVRRRRRRVVRNHQCLYCTQTDKRDIGYHCFTDRRARQHILKQSSDRVN